VGWGGGGGGGGIKGRGEREGCFSGDRIGACLMFMMGDLGIFRDVRKVLLHCLGKCEMTTFFSEIHKLLYDKR
jgi:hypothetical protein